MGTPAGIITLALVVAVVAFVIYINSGGRAVMAEKKQAPETQDLQQAFLKGLLRRAGGERMDIALAEIEQAQAEEIGEIEIVQAPMIEDADLEEGQESPQILILRPKQ